MKKLFVAVLALAALAACNKEEVPSFNDNEAKTIEISVLNLVQETKALGGDTAQGTAEACAEFGDLKVLFATSDGAIKFEDTLAAADGTTDDTHKGDNFTEYVKDEAYADGVRRWHNVPAEIKKIAVVRYEDTDFPDGLVDKDLEDDILALAKDLNANIARPIDTMVLYGEDTLEDTGATHMVGESLFHVWKAEVNVAPKFARFEVRKIQCLELGDQNALADPTKYDFDELKLNSLTWNYKPDGGEVETHEAPATFGATLYGSYTPAADFVYKYDQNTCTAATRSNEYTPTNGAWSWNVLPGEFQDLTLDIDAYAYNYQVSYKADESDRNFPLYVTDLATDKEGTSVDNQFVAGNIYHIDLIFKQENIKTADGICVEVVVTVNPWNVVERFPVYENQ